MKKLILFTAILSFLLSAGAIAGEQDTIWTKSGLFGAIDAYFTPGDQTIITNRKNQIIELDVNTGDILRESDTIHSDFLQMELSKLGNYILLMHFDVDYATLVNYSDFSIKAEFPFRLEKGFTKSIAISADEKHIAVGTYHLPKESYIIVFDIETKDTVQIINTGNQNAFDLKYSPDGRYLAALTRAKDYSEYPDDYVYYIQLYDANTYQYVKTLDKTTWHTQDIYSIDFSRDGSFLYEACNEKNSIIWNIDNFSKFNEYSLNNFIAFIKFGNNKKYTAITAPETARLKLYIYDNEINKLVHMYPYDIADFDISNNENYIIGQMGGAFYLLIPYWKMNDVYNKETESILIINYSNNILSVDYKLESPIQTEINIYDNSGKMIKSIFSGLCNEGINHIEESIDLVSGVYHLQVKIGDREMVKKFIVVR